MNAIHKCRQHKCGVPISDNAGALLYHLLVITGSVGLPPGALELCNKVAKGLLLLTVCGCQLLVAMAMANCHKSKHADGSSFVFGW